jgi:putative Mg2+ transporter-C (MgtC) family protein
MSFCIEKILITLLKMSLSILFTFISSIEREFHSHPGGVTTHILVSIGSCVFTIISIELQNNNNNGDVARIAAQIVSGIGFLGSATVYKSNNFVKGINSAAGIWISAGIGMAVGASFYDIGLVVSGITFLVFLLNNRYKNFLYKHKKDKENNNDIESPIVEDIFVDDDN